MPAHGRDDFECPLCNACFRASLPSFPDYQASNQAIRQYQQRSAHADPSVAQRLYFRHMSMVRKVLSRFCRQSRCLPGRCLPEELVGETYPLFRRALDAYDPSRGVDFVGYASQRLYWDLEHIVRRLTDSHAVPVPRVEDFAPVARESDERRVLDTLLVRNLLEHLKPADARLLQLDAAGYSCGEIAAESSVSPGAIRKRLERARRRLRIAARELKDIE